MSYLFPGIHDSDQWPDHPQRFTTISQFRDSCINLDGNGLTLANRGLSFAGIGPKAFKIERCVIESTNVINGETIAIEGWQYWKHSPEGLERKGPQFESVKNLVRWLWFAHAKEQLESEPCERCGAIHSDTNQVKLYSCIDEGMGIESVHLCESCIEGYTPISYSHAALKFNVETGNTRRYWCHSAIMDNDLMAECDDCADDHPRYNLEEICGSDICESCRDDHYRYCEDSSRYVHEDYVYFSTIDDCWYEDASNMPSAARIRSYSANVLHEIGNECYIKNKNVHLRNAGDALLFGVELETDTRRGFDPADLAEAVLDEGFEDYGICKEDSTVSGIEMVTLPCDLESHLTLLSWEKWCDALRPMAKGHYGADNGIHIHVSRAALPKLVLGKMLVFMNSPRHKRFIETIAQRALGSWCPQSDSPKMKQIGRAGNDPFMGKYAILNTTNETVECRMFNSTLLHERMFKNLEFLHALVGWCSIESAKVINKGDDCSMRLVDHIDNRSNDYPHLHSFITNRLEA